MPYYIVKNETICHLFKHNTSIGQTDGETEGSMAHSMLTRDKKFFSRWISTVQEVAVRPRPQTIKASWLIYSQSTRCLSDRYVSAGARRWSSEGGFDLSAWLLAPPAHLAGPISYLPQPSSSLLLLLVHVLFIIRQLQTRTRAARSTGGNGLLRASYRPKDTSQCLSFWQFIGGKDLITASENSVRSSRT